jgi:hypothetical protein
MPLNSFRGHKKLYEKYTTLRTAAHTRGGLTGRFLSCADQGKTLTLFLSKALYLACCNGGNIPPSSVVADSVVMKNVLPSFQAWKLHEYLPSNKRIVAMRRYTPDVGRIGHHDCA